MGCAALVTLAWAAWAATAASAARYVDYSGVKMPQYGPGDYESVHEPAQVAPAAEDYHGHSPDASASLDYKFEDDAHVELPGKSERSSKEMDERESWSKYARRHNELTRLHDDENLETLNKYEPELEEISKIKLNRRLSVYPLRQKIKTSRMASSPQKVVKHKRGRSERTDYDIDYQGGRGKKHEGNRKNIEEAKPDYTPIKVTERIIRRKPRDRHSRGKSGDVREISEDTLESNHRMRLEPKTETEYGLHDEDRDRTIDREVYRPIVEEGDDAEIPSKRRNKAYDDYGDYYDMKRVHNIKNKLPTLLRRTSARVAPPTVTSTDALGALWTHRRSALAGPAPPPSPLAGLSVVPLPSSSIATTTSVTGTASTSIAVTTSTSRTTTKSQEAHSNASSEISLAEKSRLSIMKKAQRKENVRSYSSTKKPPVLLQVADKRLTVVVVEPPSSEGPWMRAREVAEDTPDRVDRAKRLMRRKLVARAKNIQDLTDNWDEMVCDYIDVSLLDAAPPPPRPAHQLLSFVLLLFVM